MKNHPARADRFRLVHEALFSLNIGLAIRWAMAQANYVASELAIKLWINRHLHLHPHSNVGEHAALFILAIEVALGIFLLLRLLSTIFWTQALLRSIAGVLSLAALPTCWLYATHRYAPFPGPGSLNPPPLRWLYLELTATVLCAIFYISSKWPFAPWSSISLLVVHFGFWSCLLIGGPYFWFDPVDSVFVLLSLCSSLAWAAYVSSQRRAAPIKGVGTADAAV